MKGKPRFADTFPITRKKNIPKPGRSFVELSTQMVFDSIDHAAQVFSIGESSIRTGLANPNKKRRDGFVFMYLDGDNAAKTKKATGAPKAGNTQSGDGGGLPVRG